MALQCLRCGRWLPQIDGHICMDQKLDAALERLEKLDSFLEEQIKLLKEEVKALKERHIEPRNYYQGAVNR